MSKKLIVSTLLLAVLLFSFPKPASAIIGTGAFDYFDAALSGIEEKAGPVAGKILAFFFTYIVGIIALSLSVVFLEGAVDPNLVSLRGNALVGPGWNFTVGIANMFIIIILLYIAFSFILKIDNQQMRKALPRLIMVAILLNFSLLFVGMLVDIGNITINTFFAGEENLPSLITEKLRDSMALAAGTLGSWIVTMAGLFMVPFLAPLAQFRLVVTVATLGAWGPTITGMIFQLLTAFMISTIFLIYAILFLARAFIIQLLAILAPLAFLTLILPQTKKYWDKWLHLLLEWIFLGVALFFFMVLGFRALHMIAPEQPWEGVIWYTNFDGIRYYIFLTLYLAVAFFLAKKTMPEFAQAVIDQAKGIGQMAWGRVAVPLGGAAKEKMQQFAISQKKREDDMEAAKARGEKVKIGRGLAMGVGRYMRRGIESAHWASGTTVSAAMARNLSKKTDEYEKRYGKDFVGAAKNFSNLRTNFDQAAMTLFLEKTKGGKSLGKLGELEQKKAVRSLARYAPHRVEDIIKHMPELIKDENMMPTIQVAMMSAGTAINEKTGKFEDKDLQKMKDSGVKIDGQLIDDLIKSEEGRIKVTRAALYKKAVEAAKNEDIDNMTDATLSNSDYQEAIARYKNISFIRKIGEEKGSASIQNIRTRAEELGAEEIAKTNTTLLYSTVTNPGVKAIFPPIKGATNIKEINNLTAKVRERVATSEIKITPGTEEESQKTKRGEKEIKKSPEEKFPRTGEEGASKGGPPRVGSP